LTKKVDNINAYLTLHFEFYLDTVREKERETKTTPHSFSVNKVYAWTRIPFSFLREALLLKN